MSHPSMKFIDVDWSFVDRVEEASYKTHTATVVMRNGNRFKITVPRDLFNGIWDEAERHVLEQEARMHDDHFLGDGDIH